MHSNTLSLAVWQCPYAPSTEAALARLEATAAQARRGGAQWLVCPEMSLTGYLLGEATVAALAQAGDAALAQAVARIARRHGIAIVYGFAERHPAGARPYNTVQAIGPDGQLLARYRKTHLFGPADQAQFSPGPEASQVFEWQGWHLGLLVCYDVEFPETVRDLALQEVDAVLVPTANMLEFDEVPQLLLPARACENRVYVVYANACGQEADTVYGGLSTVCGPAGTVLAQAAREETLLQLTLQRQALTAGRSSSQLAHRRPALYARLSAPSQET
jgi:predicted amidohydrolase